MNQIWPIALILSILGCGRDTKHAAPPPASPSSRFEALESRLLTADTVQFSFHVTAEGAVEADLTGEANLTPTTTRLTATGTFAGQPVDLLLHRDGDAYEFGNANTHNNLPAPPELKEALLLGLTRMGILHNLARLTGGAPPDHAYGDVRTWVTVDSLTVAAADSAAIAFNLTVAGQPSGSASLQLDAAGLPVVRRQVVQFPSGEMRVEERYADVIIRP